MDITAVHYLNSLGVPPGVVLFFSTFFPYALVVVFVYVVCRVFSGRERLLILAESAISAVIVRVVIVEVIRFFYHRPRPFAADPAITSLLSERSYSFPSGHAAFFFALSTTAYLHNKKLGITMYAATLIILIARIMAGVHYPTDILGGALFGIIIATVVFKIANRKRAVAL